MDVWLGDALDVVPKNLAAALLVLHRIGAVGILPAVAATSVKYLTETTDSFCESRCCLAGDEVKLFFLTPLMEVVALPALLGRISVDC